MIYYRCRITEERFLVVLLFIISVNIMLIVPPFVQPFASAPFGRQQQHQRERESFKVEATTANYLDSLSTLEVASPQSELVTAQERSNDNNISSEALSPQSSDCNNRSSSSNESKSINKNIESMTWDGQQISENAFRVNLPPLLLKELRDYAGRMGITNLYRQLLVEGRPLPPGGERAVKFSRDDNNNNNSNNSNRMSYNWMVQRPKSHWKSNMHWTSPADEKAHDDYLRVLSKGGFDSVLQEVGEYFSLDAISAYHLSFIGVSHCEKGFIHTDVNDSGRKAFNMIIPLILQQEEVRSDDSSSDSSTDSNHPYPTGELEILSDDETTTRFYKYEYNAASMVGDHALHATAACDYRHMDTINGMNMRLAATVYLGDITPANVNHLLLSLTQAYPPVGDAQHLLDRAGNHWNKLDPAKKLPSPHGDAYTTI